MNYLENLFSKRKIHVYDRESLAECGRLMADLAACEASHTKEKCQKKYSKASQCLIELRKTAKLAHPPQPKWIPRGETLEPEPPRPPFNPGFHLFRLDEELEAVELKLEANWQRKMEDDDNQLFVKEFIGTWPLWKQGEENTCYHPSSVYYSSCANPEAASIPFCRQVKDALRDCRVSLLCFDDAYELKVCTMLDPPFGRGGEFYKPFCKQVAANYKACRQSVDTLRDYFEGALEERGVPMQNPTEKNVPTNT